MLLAVADYFFTEEKYEPPEKLSQKCRATT